MYTGVYVNLTELAIMAVMLLYLMDPYLALVIRFCRTFRYIDDLLTLNNSSFKIYPPELKLKRTSEGPTTCSYLDLQ